MIRRDIKEKDELIIKIKKIIIYNKYEILFQVFLSVFLIIFMLEAFENHLIFNNKYNTKISLGYKIFSGFIISGFYNFLFMGFLINKYYNVETVEEEVYESNIIIKIYLIVSILLFSLSLFMVFNLNIMKELTSNYNTLEFLTKGTIRNYNPLTMATLFIAFILCIINIFVLFIGKRLKDPKKYAEWENY